MNVDRSVRRATAIDVAAIGAVQESVWRTAYGGVLPAYLLAELTGPALAASWRPAVVTPPSTRHHVLVACTTSEVVGFAAFGPSDDADLDGAFDAELHGLMVRPDARGGGHGSRLLQAAVDVLLDDAFRHAYVWLGAGDEELRRFLVGAGWEPDGATRSLDLRGDGEVIVAQLRLQTALDDEAA